LQLQLQLPWPEQISYELIRPVVLFGCSPAERAKHTGVPERTLRRKAERFDAEGMASLFPPASPQLLARYHRRSAARSLNCRRNTHPSGRTSSPESATET
ncbi:MAG: hypothetical protein QOE53_2730, partial [Pseudonocardiales bacterium]|nr:hypothetical protein [Pseudonocardiales bacterium]